jgi:hypothetical protein
MFCLQHYWYQKILGKGFDLALERQVNLDFAYPVVSERQEEFEEGSTVIWHLKDNEYY